MYRVMVFFWILAGLTWLGGVVSMLTDLLNLSVSYQFDFTILANNLSFPIIFQRILPRRQSKNPQLSKIGKKHTQGVTNGAPIKTYVPDNTHYNQSHRKTSIIIS